MTASAPTPPGNQRPDAVAEATDQLRYGGDVEKAAVWAQLAIAQAIYDLAYEISRVGSEMFPIHFREG